MKAATNDARRNRLAKQCSFCGKFVSPNNFARHARERCRGNPDRNPRPRNRPRNAKDRKRKQQANRDRIVRLAATLRDRVKQLFDAGKTDLQISKEISLGREVVKQVRLTLQLRRPRFPSHCKIPDGFGSEEQYAISRGWPKGLRVREVQLLELLWDGGPMTTWEIAARFPAIGESRICNICTDLARRKFVLRTPRIDNKSFVILSPEVAVKRLAERENGGTFDD